MLASALSLLSGIAASSQSPVGQRRQTQPGRVCNTTEQPLVFSHDGTFQVSIFEDLHFAESRKIP
jgi:hypothetical protein